MTATLTRPDLDVKVLDEDEVCHLVDRFNVTACGARPTDCESTKDWRGQQICPDCGRLVCPECIQITRKDMQENQEALEDSPQDPLL